MSNIIIPKEFASPGIIRPVDDSLVLWIRGQMSRRSGSVLEDLSKKKQPCVNHGATWGNTLLGHSVLNFDGENDYVNCGNDPSLNFGTSNFAIETWFKTTQTTEGIIICKDTYTGESPAGETLWELSIYTNAFNLYTDAGNIRSSVCNDGNWHHAVLLRDGDDGKIYLDGVLDKTNANYFSGLSLSNDKHLYLGSRSGVSGYFDGSIDEVRILNRALSADEIMMRYWNTRYLYGF